MKKIGLFFMIFMLLAVSSFAQDFQNRYLYIEGMASRSDHQDFFQRSFVMEAGGTGYVVTSSRAEATHTLRFNVVTDVTVDPYAYDEYETIEQFVITMSLYRNEDNAQLITFNFNFATIEEMYPFVRTLFLNSVTSIPLPLLTEDYLGKQWDKWIYFRASFDYPITFYVLQPTGLKGGQGIYSDDPPRSERVGHEIMAMPGATVGMEFQLLNFLSIELNFQMSMGDTRNNYFVNMGAAAELKFPIKFHNVMFVPYGAFFYPLNDALYPSPVFSEFPLFATGGGIQACARAGKRGVLFLDVQYLFSLTDAMMHNPYLALPADQQYYPEPAVIHYKRSYVGIGIGYKVGIIDRPSKKPRLW